MSAPTRTVECLPCPAKTYQGPCRATRMNVRETHAWCAVCGGAREVGAEVVKPHPTPPHRKTVMDEPSRLLERETEQGRET